jgi:hypothetical protein
VDGVDDVDDDFLRSKACIAGIPLPKKSNQIDDTFDWIQQKDVRLAEIDDLTIQALVGVSNIDLPLPKFTPSMIGAVAESSMNWLRENFINADKVDDIFFEVLAKYTNYSLPRFELSP